MIKHCHLIVSILLLAITGATRALSEPEQLALEASGKLLYPPELAQRIEKDLTNIRSKYSAVSEVRHSGKWEPGKLIVSNPKKEALEKLNISSYGPVEVKAIFQNKIYTVSFNKPYHPIRLAEILKREFGIDEAEPNGSFGGSSSITLSFNGDVYTYVFYKGSGDCFSGCINKKYWTFRTGPEKDSVVLVKETGNNRNRRSRKRI